MTEQDKPSEEEKVSCAVCLKEVPISEAKVDEAVDYVSHFCGLECYEKWKAQEKNQGRSFCQLNILGQSQNLRVIISVSKNYYPDPCCYRCQSQSHPDTYPD